MNCMALFRLEDCKVGFGQYHETSLSHEMMRFFHHSQVVRPLYVFFHLLFISVTSNTGLIPAGMSECTCFLNCLSSVWEILRLLKGNSAELTKLEKDHWPGHCGWRHSHQMQLHSLLSSRCS